MCCSERYTESRGRSSVPRTFFLTRPWRNLRFSDRSTDIATPIRPSTGTRSGCRFTGLTSNRFGLVFDTFALVRLRRSQPSDFRSNRSQQLTVGALQRQRNLALNLGRNLRRQLIDDWMRVAQGQIDQVALDVGAIAYAIDLEHRLKALAHALGHIGHELAHQTMHCTFVGTIARTFHHDLGIGNINHEARMYPRF